MKALSPVFPPRRDALSPREHGPWLSPVKGDMEDCYSRLKELVPSLPRDRGVSNMEILQHVIDYILDLQVALGSEDPAPASPLRHRGELRGNRDQGASLLE